MRQQMLEREVNNLKDKLIILARGGNKAEAVRKEVLNEPWPAKVEQQVRDPENLDPYGAQNHPLPWSRS